MGSHRAPSRFTWLLASTLLLPAGGAAAQQAEASQRAYIVAVPMQPDLEAVAARVGAAARAALRQVPGVDWEGPDQAFLGYSNYNLSNLRQARERLDQGRQAYLDLELGTAIDALRGAVEDFDGAAAALEDPQDLGEALLYLGASQSFEGQNRDARRTFARLHVQMPHISPDPNLFNPDVVQTFERARPRDARNPSGRIVIESEPPGAIAYVDYVARGRTPITVDRLAAGLHVVRVTRPGATPFVQQVEIRRRGSEQIAAYLEDNPDTAGLADAVLVLPSASDEEIEQGGPTAELAIALSADKLGVIRVAAGSDEGQVALELLMFDVGSGDRLFRMSGPVPMAIGELEAGVRQLVSQALQAAFQPRSGQGGDTEAIPAFGGGGPPVGGDSEDPAIYERWWFWAGVGGAVALGVILTLVLTADGGQELATDRGGQIILSF